MAVQNEVRAVGACLLDEARAIRAAFPDAAAMRDLPVSPLPPGGANGPEESECRAALGYLRNEMLLVQAGRATSLVVLDDEIAGVERLLPGR